MSTVKDQAIPASLVDGFNEIFAVADYGAADRLSARFKTPSGLGTQTKQQSHWARFCAAAGTALATSWAGHLSPAARSAFYAERMAELRRGEFPHPYWAPSTLIADHTQKGVPDTVTAFTGYVNPAYYDALRRPSTCPITRVSATYATPTGNGTPQALAPGWSGTVIDTLWRDLYQTQRRVTLALPFAVNPSDRRPMGLRIAAEIQATATTRGHEWWFHFNTRPHFWLNGYPGRGPSSKMLRWLPSDFLETFRIPDPKAGGWTHTRAPTILRNAYSMSTADTVWTYDRCTLDLQTPCSGGRTFSRNDDVTVYHREDVALYVARTPHD